MSLNSQTRSRFFTHFSEENLKENLRHHQSIYTLFATEAGVQTPSDISIAGSFQSFSA
jgi:hypothetical protein